MSDEQLLLLLRAQMSADRLARMQHVLSQRTRYVIPVFENMYQPHNIHAALRSVECQGFHEVHIIDEWASYEKQARVSKGAAHWLHILKYAKNNNGISATSSCLESLRNRGYRLYAADFSENAYTPYTLPLDTPVAVIMGTEQVGISAVARNLVDGIVQIPMCGFTQSYNVSVALGILAFVLRQRLAQLPITQWSLAASEQQEIELAWLLQEARWFKRPLIDR